MSDAQQASSAENPTTSPTTLQEPVNPLVAGIAWVAKHWPRVRLGHEALMLEKIKRQQECVETLARNAMTGQFDDKSGWPEGEMAVAVGDRIVNIYLQPSKDGSSNASSGQSSSTTDDPSVDATLPVETGSSPAANAPAQTVDDLSSDGTVATQEVGGWSKLIRNAVLAAVLVGGGATIPMAVQYFAQPSSHLNMVDTDTSQRVTVEKAEPTLKW